MNSILNKDVSYYDTVSSQKPKTEDLYDLLTGEKYKERVERVRQIKASGDDAGYKEAKRELPCYTVSGIFYGSGDGTLSLHSGLICIDIDKKDNPQLEDFDDMKAITSALPYVAYCGHSVSGEGYFIVIPIRDTRRHVAHFLSLEKAFARCGIKIDTQCKNVGRKRFVSYDAAPYIDPEAEVYTRAVKSQHNKQATAKKKYTIPDAATHERVKAIVDFIEETGTDITEGRNNWIMCGAALANGYREDGREMFHAISRHNPDYTVEETDRVFDDCLRNGHAPLPSLIRHAKACGIKAAMDFKDIQV